MLTDNAKHNQHSRVDEHGVIRHRHLELCAIGALTLMFFSHFHVLDCAPPAFAPDFTNKDYGEYSHWEWYSHYVFNAGLMKKEMSYDSKSSHVLRKQPKPRADEGNPHHPKDHHECITVMQKKNNIDITKKTHAGRHYAAQTARAHGASTSGTKALGGWNESRSFNSVYDHAFPLDALLRAAMYNGRRPKEYALPRGCLGEWCPPSHLSCGHIWVIADRAAMPTVPPRDLLAEIFPFIESAQAELQEHVCESSLVTDIALKQFLSVLSWFRTVLLQDGAVLYSQHPKLPVFRFHPFDTPQFWSFAAQSVQQVANAEETSWIAFQNLPQHLITSL